MVQLSTDITNPFLNEGSGPASVVTATAEAALAQTEANLASTYAAQAKTSADSAVADAALAHSWFVPGSNVTTLTVPASIPDGYLLSKSGATFTGAPGVTDAQLPVTAQAATLAATYATGGEVRSKVKTDGTDQTATLRAELDALTLSGAGGTLILPAGTVTIAGVLTLTNDGATPPKQAPVTLRGTGSHWSGRGTAPVGGTILAFSATDTYGLLKTNGLGLLRVEGVTFLNVGTTTTPFIYTTNTTLHVSECSFVGSKTGAACDQDAIVCGGLTNVEGFAGWNDGFQGYGTVIARNFFSGIRRAVYGRTFFNGNAIVDNTVWSTCGFLTGAAFELDGDAAGTASGSLTVGNIIGDNLIELASYKWAVRLRYAGINTVRHNQVFDAATVNASAAVRADSVAQNNIVMDGFTDNRAVPIDDQSGTTLFYAATPGVSSVAPPTKFPDQNHDTSIFRLRVTGTNSPLLMQPDAARPDGSYALEIKRSTAETTNPGASVYAMYQDGTVVFDPTAKAAGNVTGPFSAWSGGGRTWSGVGTAAGQTDGATMTQDSGPGGSYFDHKNYGVRFWDHNGGPLRAVIGAGVDGVKLGTASDVIVQRDGSGALAVNAPFKTLASTTVARPAPASAGAGAQMYDTTLSKPIWSDGTNWRDAMGTIV